MKPALPVDLKEAEQQLFISLMACINQCKENRLKINLAFNGLKLAPLVIRIAQKIDDHNKKLIILFPDFGSAALAQRDFPAYKSSILTFKEYLDRVNSIDVETIILAVSPQPYDFDQFSKLVEQSQACIVMFNGRLEDTAVGIGSVGRDRRFSFISSWTNIYSLEPIRNGALLYSLVDKWNIFISTSLGYKHLTTLESKPDSDAIDSYISEADI